MNVSFSLEGIPTEGNLFIVVMFFHYHSQTQCLHRKGERLDNREAKEVNLSLDKKD